MLVVHFHDRVNDNCLKFAVIIAKYKDMWVFCKHKERNTYECPGGHRELGEDILETAKRELFEETGAIAYSIEQIGGYSVYDGESETFGMLFYAEIHEFGDLPNLEMERIELFDDLPKLWTYPQIQPILLEHVMKKRQ
jgi:8-oxo-dGTP diphosphatase